MGVRHIRDDLDPGELPLPGGQLAGGRLLLRLPYVVDTVDDLRREGVDRHLPGMNGTQGAPAQPGLFEGEAQSGLGFEEPSMPTTISPDGVPSSPPTTTTAPGT